MEEVPAIVRQKCFGCRIATSFAKVPYFIFSCNGGLSLTSSMIFKTEAYKNGELQEVLEKAICS